MPLLKDVLPPEFMEERFATCEARTLRDTPVAKMKLTTGAPCSSHAELFAAWPGVHAYVEKWFILTDGRAVGINEDPDDGLSFPVIICDQSTNL